MATEQKPTTESRIVRIDTHTSNLKTYLDKAAADINKGKKEGAADISFHAGEAMKMALIRLAADIAGLKGAERAEFAKMLDSTPGWFGCGNNSACRQFYGKKADGTTAISEDYAKW